jgi:hypothetical protein
LERPIFWENCGLQGKTFSTFLAHCKSETNYKEFMVLEQMRGWVCKAFSLTANRSQGKQLPQFLPTSAASPPHPQIFLQVAESKSVRQTAPAARKFDWQQACSSAFANPYISPHFDLREL